MRLLYPIIKLVVQIPLWIYFPRFKTINTPKKRCDRTIFMCNHPSSFMDPLVMGGLGRPILFFMTRSDVFTPLLKPILWSVHMLPIYRKKDGKDVKKANTEVFKSSSKILERGRNILVFAEGFTDDVFVRCLKPIKKGGVRIGFYALEAIHWEKEIFIQAVGLNYSNPNVLGSDCVMKYGNAICLNEYREEYEENPNLTITRLTKRMEEEMRNQITDVCFKELTSFHENIMRITRKGMHPTDTDFSIPLIERQKFSKALADWMNTQHFEENDEVIHLKKELEVYFDTLKKQGVSEHLLYTIMKGNRNKTVEILILLLLFPLLIIGLILNYIPFLFTKKFTERQFKRRVFWSSVKMMLGTATVGLYNIVLFKVISLTSSISFSFLLSAGVLFVPIMGLIAYNWFKRWTEYKELNALEKRNIEELISKRKLLEKEIERLI